MIDDSPERTRQMEFSQSTADGVFPKYGRGVFTKYGRGVFTKYGRGVFRYSPN